VCRACKYRQISLTGGEKERRPHTQIKANRRPAMIHGINCASQQCAESHENIPYRTLYSARNMITDRRLFSEIAVAGNSDSKHPKGPGLLEEGYVLKPCTRQLSSTQSEFHDSEFLRPPRRRAVKYEIHSAACRSIISVDTPTRTGKNTVCRDRT